VPDALLEARWVSMWGVFTRYDDLETMLDRVAAIEVVTRDRVGAQLDPGAARAAVATQSGTSAPAEAQSRWAPVRRVLIGRGVTRLADNTEPVRPGGDAHVPSGSPPDDRPRSNMT